MGCQRLGSHREGVPYGGGAIGWGPIGLGSHRVGVP